MNCRRKSGVRSSRRSPRVLKPGGSFLFVDSLQTGDVPEYDGLLSVFPQLFHEPYFTSYLSEDLTGIAKAAGLEESWMVPAFVSPPSRSLSKATDLSVLLKNLIPSLETENNQAYIERHEIGSMALADRGKPQRPLRAAPTCRLPP